MYSAAKLKIEKQYNDLEKLCAMKDKESEEKLLD